MDNPTPGRISLELIPRDAAQLEAELALVKEEFPAVTTINIPDLLRFPLRSWEGCYLARSRFSAAIPHIRAMDLDPARPLPMAEGLRAHGITEVLIITGDPPQEMRRIYPTTALEAIRKFKRELPEIKVYAGIDQYRTSPRGERDYVARKLEAGADGFFTQPFFDLRLMEIYAELTADTTMFWGVSPVVSERSQSYWENSNHAIFPREFRPTLEWNQQFARRLLQLAHELNGNTYLMPIRLDLRQYLAGVFQNGPETS